jgi:hypothetical protein
MVNYAPCHENVRHIGVYLHATLIPTRREIAFTLPPFYPRQGAAVSEISHPDGNRYLIAKPTATDCADCHVRPSECNSARSLRGDATRPPNEYSARVVCSLYNVFAYQPCKDLWLLHVGVFITLTSLHTVRMFCTDVGKQHLFPYTQH